MKELNNDREKLIDAITRHQNELVDELLLTMPNLAHEKTDEGASMLMHALYCRNMLATQLIAAKYEQFSLHEEVSMGQLDNVMEMTEQCQHVNQFAGDGYTPLGLACLFAQNEIAAYLIRMGANVNLPSNNAYKVAPIHAAASTNNSRLVELLIEKGAEVNVMQASGFTPLHAAAFHGNDKMVLALLKAGANVHVKNQTGYTPADLAREQGYTDLADKL